MIACRALGLNYSVLMATSGLIGVTITSARTLGIEYYIAYYQTNEHSDDSSISSESFSFDKKDILRREEIKIPNQQQINWSKQITGNCATIQSILTLFQKEGHVFDARTLATTAHRIAKLYVLTERKKLGDKRIYSLADTCRQRIAEMHTHSITNTVWAFATLGIEVPRLFATVAGVALNRMESFSHAALSTLVWAFAVAKYKAPRLFTAIADEAIAHIDQFNPLELTNIAWAMAVTNQNTPKLFHAIALVSSSKVSAFNLDSISSLTWALGSSKTVAPHFFASVEQVLFAN
mmetsp:Transcript_3852/g.5855  ORF Transcript_3852/g.5855 Transcript_3852/m.5855 type:complete len:292 (+) Transcript_3852:195-1070(+)